MVKVHIAEEKRSWIPLLVKKLNYAAAGKSKEFKVNESCERIKDNCNRQRKKIKLENDSTQKQESTHTSVRVPNTRLRKTIYMCTYISMPTQRF